MQALPRPYHHLPTRRIKADDIEWRGTSDTQTAPLPDGVVDDAGVLAEHPAVDMSGYEVLKTLRVSKVQTPILILSGLAGIEDKVRGLGFGADDYMTKPFHKDELIARIHAIVRRSKGHAQSVINTGDLVVNLDTKTVEVGGQRVHLTGKEYQMLELLSLRKGTTLTKEMFLNHLYGGMSIKVTIRPRRLRTPATSDGESGTAVRRSGAKTSCTRRIGKPNS